MEQWGKKGERGVVGGAAHKQPVSVAKYVDSTHNMKPEQEKEEASNVATVAWARALQKKHPRARVTARVGERERQKVKQARVKRRDEQRRSTGWGFPNECSMNEFQPQNTNSMENSFFHTIGN